MGIPANRILVVEDDPGVISLLRQAAPQVPCAFEFSPDPEVGLARAISEPFVAIVLDIVFTGHSGLDICREIRCENRSVPILILSSLSKEVDKVVGLEMGADDYLTKPFGAAELVARLRALLRRAGNRVIPADLKDGRADLDFGQIRILGSQRRVWVGSREIELTSLEFDLLYYLALRPGTVCSREELAENVWGYKVSEFSSTVTAQFCRLRAKLEPNPAKPKFVLSARGVGYRFMDPNA